jgi:hypothetical protein
MVKTERRLLNIDEAAEMAGYSARHFQRIILRDEIRYCTISGKWFVGLADFAAWMQYKSPRKPPSLDQ